MGNLEASGITTGAIVFASVLVGSILLMVIAPYLSAKFDEFEGGAWEILTIVGACMTVIMIIIGFLYAIPRDFQTKYITTYTGTVVLKEERVLFEYQFEGDDTLYNFNDFRIHTYKGKQINVRCVPYHVRHGIDKNYCSVTSLSGAN